MEIEEILGYIIETYGVIIIGISVIKIIYFVVLLCKICDTANQSFKINKDINDIYDNQLDELHNQREIIRLLSEQNEKLDRIAYALEQDSEPYVIEKKEGS